MEPYDYEEDQLSPIARLARTAKKINNNLGRIATAFESIANALEALTAGKNRPNLTPAEEAIVAGESLGSPEEKMTPKESEKNSDKDRSSLQLAKLTTKQLIELFKEYSVSADLFEIYMEIARRNRDGKVTKEEREQINELLADPEKCKELLTSQVEVLTTKPTQEEPASTWGNIPLSKIATNHLLKLFEIAPTPEDEHEFYLELMQRKQEGKLTKKEDRQFQKLLLNSNDTEYSAMSENDPLPHW